MHRTVLAVVIAATSVLAAGAQATVADRKQPDPNVAGLQTALALKRLYHGPIDGIAGPQTAEAVRALQRRARLATTRIGGDALSAALGRLGRPRYATRAIRRGMIGLDVAALQFELRYHGFPSRERGRFGATTYSALTRFQRFARIRVDGVAGGTTFAALALPPPAVPKLRPPLASLERVRRLGNAVELFCPYASPVAATTAGTVVVARDRHRGYGYTVATRDARGLEVVYAHLARIDVDEGQRVAPGALIGLAGWTGKKVPTTSLRLELRLRGAQLNALAAIR